MRTKSMRIPVATYRIQFEPRFGFRKAKRIVSYLKKLGISDIYASPIFRARPGSTHGYDVLDPRELNPELGGKEAFAALADRVRQEEMGWLQDIVPNHMAYDARNPYLGDVLENGQDSRYYRFFDIDWDHYYETIRGKVLIPFLGSFYGEALEQGEIRLGFDHGGFHVTYGPLRFPVRLESYLTIIAAKVGYLRHQLGEDHPDFIQFLGVLYILKTLAGEPIGRERYDQIKFVKHTLSALYDRNEKIRRALKQTLSYFNGRKGRPESFDALENLLAEQWYRLSFWKVASEEINYRRFFCINDLIALNICRPEVFAETHENIFQLLKEGLVTGLRIDHIDSLYEPSLYLGWLREKAGEEVYMVAEKILADKEDLPAWPVQGTTGYDFLAAVIGVFCQTKSEKKLSGIYRRFSGMQQDYEDLAQTQKKLIVEKHMFGDINNLAHLLKNLTSRHRLGSDLTMDSLKQTLAQIMVAYPVYRTYLGPEKGREADSRILQEAVDKARKKNPGLLNELNFIEKIFLRRFDEHLPEEERLQYQQFVMRFQQYTGTLMAKGVEDTLFYVYNRLLSLNEVGGRPDRFGLTLEAFHEFNQKRQENWPQSLNATATHDTKRGEDLRARLNVLSEVPQDWGRSLKNWSRINREHKGTLHRRKVPDKNDEYFFYQTLIGVYPFGDACRADLKPRLRGYLVKAVREAKVHTAWLKPDTAYEEAYLSFVDAVLDQDEDGPFWKEFRAFQRKVAWLGIFGSLGQTLAKMTAPGIPDFYQGSELWDLSLVDPDNRRPVDFPRRNKALNTIVTRTDKDLPSLISDLLADPASGLVKMFLIHRVLRFRSLAQDLFNHGEYLSLTVAGKEMDRVIAYERRLRNQRAVVVIPRFLSGLIDEGGLPLGEEVWHDTCVEPGGEGASVWRNIITEQRLSGRKWPLGKLLEGFPVALLVNF